MTSAARIRAAALFACLCAATVARAESLFELTPPGEPLLALDAHAIALAGASEARWHLESGLPSNPAQLVAIDGVSFATVIQWRRGLRDLEGAGANWDETRQDFPAFQISAAFPRGIRFGAGYRADLRSRGRLNALEHQSKNDKSNRVARGAAENFATAAGDLVFVDPAVFECGKPGEPNACEDNN